MANAIFLITDLKQGSPFPNLQTTLRRLAGARKDSTPWSLEYRPLRAAPATESAPTNPRFNHFISLAHHTHGNYSAIDPEIPSSSQPGQIVAASSPLQSIVRMETVDEWTALYALVSSKMSSLWTARQQVQVIGGLSISTGEFSVRVGEVRVKTPAAAGGGVGVGNVALGAVRAVVVQIQLDSESESEQSMTAAAGAMDKDNDDDASSDEDERPLKEQNDEIEETKQYLRDVWGRFGISGAKEFFHLPKKGAKNDADEKLNEVRLWCEVLRPKS